MGEQHRLAMGADLRRPIAKASGAGCAHGVGGRGDVVYFKAEAMNAAGRIFLKEAGNGRSYPRTDREARSSRRATPPR
ncbi:hypothetical protein ABIC60_000010 [Phyllobacterium ifriqiyense]